MEKLLKGRGDPKKGGGGGGGGGRRGGGGGGGGGRRFCKKGEMLLDRVFFLAGV